MRRGYGRITLKLATSLDGRTAMASGESQWITGSSARQDVQRLRAEADVIVTGIGTVLADDCRLTLRADALPLSEAKGSGAGPCTRTDGVGQSCTNATDRPDSRG